MKKEEEMERKRLIQFEIVCLILGIPFLLFAETGKTSGLVDTLTKNLSLKPEQAKGAAGSVFTLAKTKMTPADFSKLAGGFPEMDSLLKAAPKPASYDSNTLTGALANQATSAMGLMGQFNSLGIPAETAGKIVPEVLNFVKAKHGDAMMGLLSKAIK